MATAETTRPSLQPTAQIARRSIHPMLVPFPIVCFIGTLVTDIAYWRTAEIMWADISAWLLLAGPIMGVLAGIAGLIDFLELDAEKRRTTWDWLNTPS